ncbi:NAD-dependent epimerase/dehydratase family protein [Natranaeroarchaeum sulfidigenes]|uniref:Nucleoside-diphosphate-sugar epimerase n=1 Tax=Natranaeroarchaeum sulfidigenes TaxID=2784880 RepID=A0A897MU17_9EURY|nr:NAD-dependent epimerase/dehydratase family protein [Natranaeroarchaeum sulfidigenes]QSG01715.1 Nucleoside-diphosphate-sugar epimerase [Natranaeroarchaeum sulfidigenes]
MNNIGPTDQNILITGGAGFIGSHLADALVPDNDVTILDNLSTGSRENVPSKAELLEGDITDSETLATSMSGMDIIYHQAAQVSVQKSVKEPVESFGTNIAPTVQILDHARNHDCRVVLASSCAIYGDPEYIPIDEAHPTTPSSPYGLEKITKDRYARLYHELYGVDTVALRYFNVYGPRQTAGDYSGVISIFNEQAQDNRDITVEGDGQQTRDFVHVHDIVQANLRAGETDAVGEAFNIGTGSSVTIKNLAETIRDVADSSSDVVHVDPREGDISHSEADIEKARTLLGYEPTIELDEGLQSLISPTA